MHKRKLHLKDLRVSVFNALTSQYDKRKAGEIPWQILDRLVDDCDELPAELRAELLACIKDRSVLGLQQLQRLAGPESYGSAAEYFSATSVLSFLKKYPFGKVADVDPEAAAKVRFYRAEKLCKQTNKRLRWFNRFPGRLEYKQSRPGFHCILHAARQKIQKWLGELDLNEIHSYTRHGPGGSIGVSGDGTTAYFKYMLTPYTSSTGALPYAEAAVLSDPLWRRNAVNQCSLIGDEAPSVADAREIVLSLLEVVDYNKVTFVPKTAFTHRAIAIEPTMNIFLQLGVGDLMANKLRHWGTDIRSQARNQKWAHEGSEWGKQSSWCPVTLDLSMASDTLSIELVRLLLPYDWYELLSRLRSRYGLLDGKMILWEKFSSMGNGFTFPLETMVFKALAESTAEFLGFTAESCSIYGDDIICPRGMALKFKEILAFAGFELNTDKSFVFGHFRESCGSDFYKGVRVRPFFLTREIKSDRDLVFVLNSLGGLYPIEAPYETCVGSGDMKYIKSFPKTSSAIFHLIDPLVRRELRGPRTENLENHIHCPWDSAQTSSLVLWDRDLQTWSYCSAQDTPVTYRGRPGPLYLQLVQSCSLDGETKPILGSVELRYLASFHPGLASVGRITGDSGNKQYAVSFRNRTTVKLATLASNGWRND